MFDWLIVHEDFYNDKKILNEITEYVADQIPNLNMQWDYKKHNDTVQIPEDFDDKDIIIISYDNVF